MRKDVSLEFLRGAAALVVLNWHLLLAFAPSAVTVRAEGGAWPLQASPLFLLFNGKSAVYLFFVLSSYVLVKRYFFGRRALDLLLGALKRLPRLAGPVLMAVLASCALFKLDLYFFTDAAAITGSGWLAHFGDAPGVLSPATASFSDAFMQGAWRTFIHGDSSYDSSLWTMNFEFWGSMIAFCLAPAVFFLAARSPRLAWCAVAVGVFLAWQASFAFVAFPASLAIYLALDWRYRPGAIARAAILAIALVLLGYGGEAVGFYRPLSAYETATGLGLNARQACAATAGGLMLVYVVATLRREPAWLTGRAARWLGDLSFPLYLVHVPVICSLGAWVLVASGSTALAAAAAALGSLLAALPLMAFNGWWVALLSRAFGRMQQRPAPTREAPAAV